ncbi:MAG: YeeE/YedE family protein [Bacteroidetes bacterium]|nr:MAG: YeeE/YedE family protein [Bacteroidota bacterium]
MDFITKTINEPWPWYVGGPLIGLTVILLLVMEKKQLGISSSLVYICSVATPFTFDYFKNPEKNKWQFYFVIGLVLGGVLVVVSSDHYLVNLNPETVSELVQLGISVNPGYLPENLLTPSFSSISLLFIGGVFVGFGARYANGCTAGHAIMGMSQLAPSSILATLSFFVGGLLTTYFILPYFF